MNGASGNAGSDGSHDEPQGTWPEQAHESFLPGMSAYDGPPRRRRAGCVVLALVSVTVIVVAGAFAVKAWPRKQDTAGLHPAAARKQDTAGFHPAGQSPSGDAEQVTTAFLRAWSSDAIGEAAGMTDDPAAARAALTAYGQDLYLRKLTGTVVSSTTTSAPGSPGDTQTAGAAAATTLEEVTFNLSAIVALQPSTGFILAIANNAQFNDFALTAAVAPGSTMKIITSTALINGGLTSEGSPVECPATYTVQGVTYRNDRGESDPAGTPFSNDFAQSCNNAFSRWWMQLNGQLASTAKSYYGLDQPWNIGIPGESATYFNAPADASGSELAQEAFGEGQLTASPLAMASVAATVDTGQFHQPVLVPGTGTVSASPLPASTDEQLKDMMRDVVTEGTAASIGLGPDVYAKTGTADVQGQDQPNSWMVAFDPDKDIAIAALVVNAGYGAQVAGPEVKTFLNGY